jgi:putative DNA primase/helicase
MSAAEKFKAAIAAAGLTPPDAIKGDGKLHRFSSNGKKSDDAGWYVLHDDERPAGRFGCNRGGVDVTWKSSEQREFTPEEKQAWRKRMQELEAQRDEERRLATARAAAESATMWDAARADDISHPYAARKQVACIGARRLKDMLLIPMRHGPGALVGLQIIQPDGSRKFKTGTPAAGAYTVLGKPTPSGPVVICEGWATGCSIHMATEWCVVVAFSAGNLEAVAKKIRAALPDARLIIAADDDAFTDGNPGITYATAAATAVDAELAVPRFTTADRGTDFNDLHVSEGLPAVRACFDGQTAPSNPTGPGAPDTRPTGSQPVERDKPASAPSAGAENNTGSSAGALPPFTSGAAVEKPPESGFPPVATRPSPAADVILADDSIDYMTWLPNCNDKGKPLATIDNLREVCRRLGVNIRYNVISKDEELLIPSVGFTVDNRANASIAWLISECAKFRMPTEQVPSFATYLADLNQYNPVVRWIESKPWDGIRRFHKLAATITAVGEDLNENVGTMKNAFIRRWMISAVAGAYRDNGVSAHGVLVFQGDQYLGKTKWFKSLVPAELGLVQDGVILKPDDRDSVKQTVSNWLVELGELDATFRKSDIAALKAFITRDRDILRRAFARKESEYARRTVFFASVNPKQFLHDPTGNRRYWTIECEAIDHSHNLDMQQVWAEIAADYKAGESWFLQPEEMESLNAHNKDFEVIDPIQELIQTGLSWSDAPSLWRWVSATDVLKELGRVTPTVSECTKAAIVIRDMNGKKSKRTGSARMLLCPKRHLGVTY